MISAPLFEEGQMVICFAFLPPRVVIIQRRRYFEAGELITTSDGRWLCVETGWYYSCPYGKTGFICVERYLKPIRDIDDDADRTDQEIAKKDLKKIGEDE